MNITVEIKAPELVTAIEHLALSLGEQVPVPQSNEQPEQPKEQPKTEPEKETSAPEKEEKPSDETKIELETVRKKLAEISQSGKQEQVKGLIQSYGVNKLTEVPEENYQELLEKAEAL